MAETIEATQVPRRQLRSERKRAAILDAAEALFVSEGYERTSVDAIAARATVSKRTVYDYFEDKQGLFLRVLERVHDALVAAVREAIEQEITEGRDLREALTAFASHVATETFPSSTYVTFRRLSSPRGAVPRAAEPVHDQPERLLEERFARLAAGGQLRVPDPRRAVQHFTALTIALALDATDDEPAAAAGQPEIAAIISDGVDAFLRAYR